MSQSLIISRYNEDISWLKPYKNFELYIYNKGEEIRDIEFKNIINLKNVGRESQTWLYHIVNNFEKLEDINIFLQGRIDDLGCMAFKDPDSYLRKMKVSKNGFIASRFGLLTPLHWKFNVGIEKNKKYQKEWSNGEISRSEIGFRKFAQKLFPEIALFVATSYGGCFAVKKETIKKYGINFYSELLDILSKHKNPIEGHYIERLWCYIFSKNDFLPKAIIDVFRTKIERYIIS